MRQTKLVSSRVPSKLKYEFASRPDLCNVSLVVRFISVTAMSNRFEQVDELQPDAISLVLEQRSDGQWAKVHCPASALPGLLQQDMVSPDLPPSDALLNAVKLANEAKLAIVVIDGDGIWKPEWGDLYRWEDEEPDEPSAEA